MTQNTINNNTSMYSAYNIAITSIARMPNYITLTITQIAKLETYIDKLYFLDIEVRSSS